MHATLMISFLEKRPEQVMPGTTTKIAENRTLSVLRRFAVPSFISLLFCAIVLFKWPGPDIRGTYLAILFCGFFWFIALKLFAETQNWNFVKYLTIGASFFLAISLHLYASPDVSLPFCFLGAGLFSSIFIAPFLNQNSSNMHIWTFSYQVLARIFLAILAAIIMYSGITAIILSLGFLFGFRVHDGFYGDLAVVMITVFLPFLVMAGIPLQFNSEKKIYTKEFKIVLYYVFLPLICIFMIIIYAYLIKIIMEFSLPKGGAAYIVTAFSLTGIFIYLASYPLQENDSIIRLYSRYFFKLLVLPLILLMLSIGVRIHDYGVTESRYAIILFLAWFGLSTFFVITQHQGHSIKFMLSSIAAMLISASFGPWSAVHLSATSQVARLQHVLEQNNVLLNGKIKMSAQKPTDSDTILINSIVDYIVSTKKQSYIKQWFDNMPRAKVNTKPELLLASDVLEDMGIGYIRPNDPRSKAFDILPDQE